MDAKALAKSKRAHSQHHSKKHHPNQTPKAPSGGPVGTGSAKKPSGKQVRDQSDSRQSQGSSGLPSNWDRYEDENDSGLEEQSSDSMNRMSDVILPKSKGSDYGYLISEAKSQSQTNMSSESFPALDDVLTDFNQGVGSLLCVRGQNLLSWMEDDNFVVEDKATAIHEASFLSLNLHALAEQLAKVDVSQRLFLEADLIPPELLVELQASTNQESDQHQAACGSEVAKKSSDEIAFHDLSEGDKNVDRFAELALSDSTISGDTVSLSDKEAKSMNQVKDEFWQSSENSQSTVMFKSEFSVNSDTKQTKQQSRFEALTAEAELDMLLNSFGETKFLEPPGVSKKPSYTTSTSSLAGFPSLDLDPADPLKNRPDLSTSGKVGLNLGDDIDDLLNATSRLTNQTRTSTSAKVGLNLGDDIDDLLNATTRLTNQNRTSKPHEVMATPLETQSSHFSHPVSKPKVLDDFDSWLDTI